jgi:V8-like Glu-specific endopeptidase
MPETADLTRGSRRSKVTYSVHPLRRFVMSIYMVERELPGISMGQLADAQKAAIDTSKQFTKQGKPVEYIRSMFVPGEDKCMCLFEAQNADTVKQVNDTAKIPYTRVVEAMDLTP